MNGDQKRRLANVEAVLISEMIRGVAEEVAAKAGFSPEELIAETEATFEAFLRDHPGEECTPEAIRAWEREAGQITDEMVHERLNDPTLTGQEAEYRDWVLATGADKEWLDGRQG